METITTILVAGFTNFAEDLVQWCHQWLGLIVFYETVFIVRWDGREYPLASSYHHLNDIIHSYWSLIPTNCAKWIQHYCKEIPALEARVVPESE